MKKILGIGNALVDVMTLINDDSILEKFKLPKGSMQLVDDVKSDLIKSETRNLKRVMASGGSAANTIHGLAMMGLNAGFIGSIGNDETGNFFKNDLKHAGVNPMLIMRKSVTGTAVALVSADSERTFATHLGAAVELEPGDLTADQFSEYQILYLEGYLIINKPLVERACILARENKMTIALDLASYNVVDARLDDFREIASEYVDILFANEDEARSFTGLDPEGALDQISRTCQIAVVKAGSEGSYIKRGDELIKVGTGKVRVKDTTGAGDLYASGFLYGYACGESLEQCGVYGSILAGHIIEVVGAKLDSKKWEKARAEIKNAAR